MSRVIGMKPPVKPAKPRGGKGAGKNGDGHDGASQKAGHG